MKIILATTADGPGGVWRHMLDLADGLSELGHDVEFALPHTAVSLISRLNETEHRWSALESRMAPDVDIWHMHLHNTLGVSAYRAQIRAAMQRRGRVVITEHLPRVATSDPTMAWDPTLRPGRKKPLARHVKTIVKRAQFRSSAGLIAVGSPSKEFLLARYGPSADAFSVIRNGVRIPDTPPVHTEVPESPLRVLAVGAVGWRKGFDVLLKSAEYAELPWEATVIGEGPLLGDLRRRSVASGRVTFVGFDPMAANAASTHDVLCVPSRAEASPYVALEAMALGRPLVASAVDGLTEIVDDGVTGLLVPPDDPVALARALDALAADPKMRVSMGVEARRRIERSFRLDEMVKRTLAVYEGCLL